MSENNNSYEGFTLGLAIVDALPVLFFGGSCILLGMLSGSPLFIAGAVLCFAGGFMKVLWKVILALKKKDIPFLNRQMKYFLMTGFALIIISFVIMLVKEPGLLSRIGGSIVSWPFILFIAVWALGMVTMGVLAKKLDSSKAKNNWIEQSVNGVSQLSLLAGLLILYFN